MRVGRPVSLAVLVPGPAALDGGLATELEARGYDLAHHLWSAQLLASDPDAIRDLHLDYYRCGARVATSASYQASRRGFLANGMVADEADSLLVRSVQTRAAGARPRARRGGAGPVAGRRVGGAVRGDPSRRVGVPRPLRRPARRAGRVPRQRLDVLAAAGPDLLAVETIPDLAEAEVVAGLLDHPAGLGVVGMPPAARARAPGSRTPTPWRSPCRPRATVAVGVTARLRRTWPRCSRPGAPRRTYRSSCTRTPAVSGTPSPGPGATRSPRTCLPGSVRSWVGAGALLVGGCCGLGPDAVSGIATALAA